ncbi:cold-shock protein [Alteriqipengyuania lutimaris]|uniref:Cold-shock protein n=1 Tax=Alteriqipengyuania lutimaris TaxID=1538146 RepID=A0A395LHV7_9SPHN|nr:cold-shock protein [Alteriqipengyuania lutimaris]MBB3034950.1 CspA family cold shock protein [Alteriqipengyuania lutimaris]RDS76229.1 cold-shock protein [Alteriqipengyuania lutimaris]
MSHTGKIHSYDTAKGAGMITPEKGGDALPFNKSDLKDNGQEPRVGQSYGYETRQVDGGKAHATSLQHEKAGNGGGQKEQAEKQKA